MMAGFQLAALVSQSWAVPEFTRPQVKLTLNSSSVVSNKLGFYIMMTHLIITDRCSVVGL